MPSTPAVTRLTCVTLVSATATLIAFEIERLRARRVLATALMTPRSVEKAWVSPPDEDGLRRRFVKPVGIRRAATVAMDFEVDEVVRRFSLAGIRIGFEHDESAA